MDRAVVQPGPWGSALRCSVYRLARGGDRLACGSLTLSRAQASIVTLPVSWSPSEHVLAALAEPGLRGSVTLPAGPVTERPGRGWSRTGH